MSDFRCCLSDPAPPKRKVCECHKKLVQFGIPLYICEENDCYGEQPKAITYEKAFRLPGILTIDEEITEYLAVEENDLPVVFEHMAQVFPTLSDYEENILSFWILDVLIEGLWTAQNAKMDFPHQKATLMWIAYFINFIQEENASRKQLFRHLKVVLFQNITNESNEEGNGETLDGCTRTITENLISSDIHWTLPLPPNTYGIQSKQMGISKEKFSDEEYTSEEYHSEEGSNSLTTEISVTPSLQTTERNISDMKTILEILFRIFARMYAYEHVQGVFNMMPSLEKVHLPFPLKIPKSLAKPDIQGPIKTEKGGKKISVSDKSVEDIEAERQLLKNNCILPLEVSEEAKEYLKQHSNERRNKEDKTKK